jgi:hypothetical protein
MIQPKIQTVYVPTNKSSNLKVGTIEREFYEEFILIDTVESQELITFTPQEFETFKREFGIELLEKAADNAYVDNNHQQGCSWDSDDFEVNKESITSVLDDYLLNNKL